MEVSDTAKAYTQAPIIMIVIGLFVCIFGALGVIGSIFAHKVIGRIILAAVRNCNFEQLNYYFSLMHIVWVLTGTVCDY